MSKICWESYELKFMTFWTGQINLEVQFAFFAFLELPNVVHQKLAPQSIWWAAQDILQSNSDLTGIEPEFYLQHYEYDHLVICWKIWYSGMIMILLHHWDIFFPPSIVRKGIGKDLHWPPKLPIIKSTLKKLLQRDILNRFMLFSDIHSL